MMTSDYCKEVDMEMTVLCKEIKNELNSFDSRNKKKIMRNDLMRLK